MKKCVKQLKADNPEFKHHLYDDNECRKFIEKNFDSNILNAYDKLIPGAYKADFWRYCILYKKGGIYMDIKLCCAPGFKLIELTDKEYYVLDRPYYDNIPLENELKLYNSSNYYESVYGKIDTNYWKDKQIGLYNAFIVCKPGNTLMLNCINQCVSNINSNYYGYNPLYPTGPGLMGDLYFSGDYSKINNINLFNSLDGTKICNRNKVILTHYSEYRNEQQKHSIVPYYSRLWKDKQIYK